MDTNDAVPNLSLDLSEKELALRESFVIEYMKDFDPFQACLRLGFFHTLAIDWSKKLFLDPYVQRKITELTRKPPVDPKVQELEDRALFENSLRENMQKGPYASRTAALRLFAEVKGWAKPDTSDAEKALIDIFKSMATKVPV